MLDLLVHLVSIAIRESTKEAKLEDIEQLPPEGSPGVFAGFGGSNDPYEPIRRQLAADAAEDEAAEPVARPTRLQPDACPSCQQKLETDEDGPLAFCYHCGAALH